MTGMVALFATLPAPDPSYLALYLLFAETAGFLAAVLSIVLYILLYFITGEYMNREELLLIADFAFSLAWWSSTQPMSPFYPAFSQSYASNAIGATELALFLSAISLVLLLVPLYTFFMKYHRFLGLRKRLDRVRSEYDSIKNEANRLGSELDNAKKSIKEIKGLIERALWLREIAEKNPNTIISGIDDTPRTPKPIRPSVYYVICGLGGTGSILLESFIDYLLSQGLIDEDETKNPYLFVFFDTSRSNIDRIKKKYAGKPVEKLMYIFDNFGVLSAHEITSHNPWLVGQDVNLIDGTGNRRALGYAAYNTVKDTLMSDILTRITNMMNKVNINPPNFLVVTLNSLGGGTGSGSFIYCASDLAEQLERKGVRPYVLGFGVLPRSDEGTIYHANAYAALKELQFLLSRAKEKLGENVEFAYPYTAYFLISRDRPSATVDAEISLAITKFLLELGIAGYEESGAGARVSGHQGYDLEDIRYRASMAPDSFFTFGRYDIYFPASRVSWLVNVALPLREKVADSYKELSNSVSKLSASVTDYSSRVESLRREVENLKEELRNLIPKLYKRWSSDANNAVNELENISREVSDPRSPISPTTLKNEYDALNSQIGTPDDSIVVLKKQVIDRFESVIKEEEEFLKSPPVTSIEYVFKVEDPEKFDARVLSREKASLASILQSRDMIADYGNALRRLVGTTGLVEQSMANVDFTRVNMPLNYTTDVVEFIARYNKKLVVTDKNTGQPTVRSPAVESIVMLVTSAQENMNVPEFPSESAVVEALREKAVHADFKKAVIDMKRYEVSSYLIITGIYPYRLRRGEPPILKDVGYLEYFYNAYKRERESKDKSQNPLLMHHTLFYGKPSAFDELVVKHTGNYTPVSGLTGSEAVKVISDFWVNYNPEVEYIDVWGILELADAYAEVSAIKRDIEELMDFMDKALTSLERGATDVDVDRVKYLLTGGVDLRRLKAIKDVREANRFAKNEEVAKAIAELGKEIEGLLGDIKIVKESIASWIDRLNRIKDRRRSEEILVMKVIQPLINEVNELDEKIEKIEAGLEEALSAMTA